MTKNTKIIIGLIIAAGGIGLFIYSNKKRQEEYDAQIRILQQKYSNQSPPRNSSDWYQWISLILKLYGEVSDLWAPGGIFAKAGVPQPGTSDWTRILTQINYIP